MTILTGFYYLIMIGAAALLSVLGLWLTSVFPDINSWNKNFFRWFFTDLLVCAFFGFLETVLVYHPIPLTAFKIFSILECLFLGIPILMMTAYQLHCCGENLRSGKFGVSALILFAVYAVLTIIAQFTESIYIIKPNMQFIRGPLYPLLLLPIIVILLFTLAGTVKRRKQLSKKVFLSLIIAMLPITIATIILTVAPNYLFLDFSYVTAGLVLLSLCISDKIDQDQRRERKIAEQKLEIANQRASIMVLQMRPHFIYNTMTSIYSLCGQDPQKARQVILDFTAYLRKNFTAIESSEPIPFSSELEHTRAYLAVEQAQYEDSLFVDYVTPHVWFRLPPLTLQPIVENAVKHGRDPYSGPFHITIRTRKTDSGSEIVVADNGRGFGFDLDDDSGPHIALKNIQQRLEIMCCGSLTITPNDGGGTVVTVTIPNRT